VLPYPIYVFRFELNAHIQVLRKAITIDGEHNNMDTINLFYFIFMITFINGQKNSCKITQIVLLTNWEVFLQKILKGTN
jgi:hypothetical protein